MLGELFDYVNGVCDPLNAFGPGDYGPSGEDVTHRFVRRGRLRSPGGFEFTTLFQAESGRPFTLTTPVDVNGFGDPLTIAPWSTACRPASTNFAARLTFSSICASAAHSISRTLDGDALRRILQPLQPQ